MSKIDIMGLDTWSGSQETVGGFAFIYGRSVSYAWVKNWQTGEECRIEVICNKLGAGISSGLTFDGIFIINGPQCGKSLADVSVGGGAEGEIVEYVSLAGPGGSAGIASEKVGDINIGAGAGASFAIYAQKCKTNVRKCSYSQDCCK